MDTLQILKQSLPLRIISTEADMLVRYGLDWTRFHKPSPLCILFPENVETLRQIVLLANEHGFPLVPSGGRTGLSGGAVALRNEVVVSMDRMNRILEWDAHEGSLLVEAGVRTQEVQDYAGGRGWMFPMSFASEGSSQIGGNIATNAGGIQVLKYGMFRDWVAGLTVVTGKGDVLELNKGLVKNATGYDFRHLFIGSEGTLGFVARARLRCCSPPKEPNTLLLALPGMEHLPEIMLAFRKVLDLSAFEFFSDRAVEYVMRDSACPAPFPKRYPFYVLMEFEADAGRNTALVFDLYREMFRKGWILDDLLGQDGQSRAKLWAYRERISPALSPYVPYKNDLSVRVSRMPDFLMEVDALVAKEYPGFDVVWFGHIADGNVHLNIIKPTDMHLSGFEAACERVNPMIFDIVGRYDGAVSAEHGVGLLKKPYLDYSRSPTEITYMKALKQVFDPNGIMNPGKLVGH